MSSLSPLNRIKNENNPILADKFDHNPTNSDIFDEDYERVLPAYPWKENLNVQQGGTPMIGQPRFNHLLRTRRRNK